MLRTIDRQSDLSLKVVMGFKQNYVITFLGCKCNICLTTTDYLTLTNAKIILKKNVRCCIIKIVVLTSKFERWGKSDFTDSFR